MKTIEEKRKELSSYCTGRGCSMCKLNTKEFTCGRGYSFSDNGIPVSDSEVERAYEKVFGKESMNTCEMVLKADQDGKTYISGDMRYSKDHGFHDKKMNTWEIDAFDSLEEFIRLDWKECQSKKMTQKEIEEALGYNIEIVK